MKPLSTKSQTKNDSTSPEPQVIDDRIAVEALDQLFHRIQKEVFTNMIVPAVVILVMWSQVNRGLLITWGVLMLIGIWVNYLIARLYLKQGLPVTEPKKWGRRMSAVMLYFGFLWVYAIFFFYVENSVGHQVFLLTIAIVFSLGSVMVGLYWFPMFYLLAVPVLLAMMVRLAMEGTLEYISLSVLILWTLVGTGVMARMLNKAVWSEMRLRHKSEALTNALHIKSKEALNATQAKSKFLAAASHDLSQPLHTLSLFIDILKDCKTEAERERIYQRIDFSLDALRKLFGALLDISRLDAKLVRPDVTHFDISELLKNLADEFKPAAKQKNLKLRVHTKPTIIMSDRFLLERILRNIINNAIRYTSSGGILITSRKRNRNVCVQIWDTGIGIPYENKEDIFVEFQQLHNVHRDREQGLGLGLAICRRLSLILNHPIDFRSQLNRGTTFGLTIQPGAADNVIATNSNNLAIQRDLSGYCILVIDDEIEILDAMGKLLSKCGCRIIISDSLEEAVDSINNEACVPDLILSDFRLRNNVTGIDVINSIRNQFGSYIQGIIITGETSAEVITLIAETGYGLLNKPVKPVHLRMAIDNCLLLNSKINTSNRTEENTCKA